MSVLQFRTEVVSPAPGSLSELGIVTKDGRDYAAMGAHVDDDRLIAYLAGANLVTTWQGEQLGTYIATKTWKYRVPSGYRVSMMQVTITLADGRRYQGRSQGPGMIVSARRIAADRKVSK